MGGGLAGFGVQPGRGGEGGHQGIIQWIISNISGKLRSKKQLDTGVVSPGVSIDENRGRQMVAALKSMREVQKNKMLANAVEAGNKSFINLHSLAHPGLLEWDSHQVCHER
eukprot:EG_transcript_21728